MKIEKFLVDKIDERGGVFLYKENLYMRTRGNARGPGDGVDAVDLQDGREVVVRYETEVTPILCSLRVHTLGPVIVEETDDGHAIPPDGGAGA